MHGNSVISTVQVIIDSDERTGPGSNTDFVYNFHEPMKNVFALRMCKYEYYITSNATVMTPINGVSTPTIDVNDTFAYLYINNYELALRDASIDSSIKMFYRMTSGTEVIRNHASIYEDPYTYTFDPVLGSLDSLQIRLYNKNNQILSYPDIRFILTLSLYRFV